MFKSLRRAPRVLALLALVAGAAACRDVSSSELEITTMEILQESTAHATFIAALNSTGTSAIINESGPYTIFAPTNAAFDKLPAAQRQAIFADPAKLRAVIRNHVVQGSHPASKLTNGTTLTTLNGTQVTVSRTGATITVSGATIILDNLSGRNGLVHVVGDVIVPTGV